MLTEFAFTPSIFDENAHADVEAWREQLSALVLKMFPDTHAWPVMVSDLCDGSWHQHAFKMIKSIKDSRSRELCRSILENAQKTLVRRPFSSSTWPEDDSIAWALEAIKASQAAPIERIVSCKATKDALHQKYESIRSIDEVCGKGFWTGITSQWSQEMHLSKQMHTLAKLFLHADFMALIAPHIEGHDNDETEFACRMLKAIARRPTAFGSTECQIHTNIPYSREWPQGMQCKIVRDAVQLICNRLRNVLVSDQSVRIVFWPRFLNRYLIAGVRTEMSDHNTMDSPRWGLSMPHFAIKSDEREARDPAFWTLLARKDVGDLHAQYCIESEKNCVHSELIER